jgi:hypothetical protein
MTYSGYIVSGAASLMSRNCSGEACDATLDLRVAVGAQQDTLPSLLAHPL